ncbi:MAG: hypothetical protein EP298_08730 [Gammaproteobacteria bacterium]|nr:MAG: hypothetical protein EP298_08730 [Gammaproteobacteria bacterium]UTW43121.1 hypothetical protein KFE69_02965 [bacterium SCSIO 12844]
MVALNKQQILGNFVKACDLSNVKSEDELFQRLTNNETLGENLSQLSNQRNEAPTLFDKPDLSNGYNGPSFG